MSFEEKVKSWVDLDNKIKKLNEETRRLRELKSNVSEKINVIINTNKLQESLLEIPGGKLKFTQTKTTQPITLKYVESCLSNIIQDQDQVQQVMNYIKDQREVKTSSDIKRYYED
jgi:hypothetical protein